MGREFNERREYSKESAEEYRRIYKELLDVDRKANELISKFAHASPTDSPIEELLEFAVRAWGVSSRYRGNIPADIRQVIGFDYCAIDLVMRRIQSEIGESPPAETSVR